jgi:hypothetical protein
MLLAAVGGRQGVLYQYLFVEWQQVCSFIKVTTPREFELQSYGN